MMHSGSHTLLDILSKRCDLGSCEPRGTLQRLEAAIYTSPFHQVADGFFYMHCQNCMSQTRRVRQLQRGRQRHGVLHRL